MSYLDQIDKKRQQSNTEAQNRQSGNELMRAAALMNARKRGDMPRSREKILDSIQELLDTDEVKRSTEQHDKLISAISELKESIESANQAAEQQTREIHQSFETMLESVSNAQTQAIDQQNSILEDIARYLKTPPKLPTPQVNITERELDLGGVEKALKSLTPKKTRDLSSYRALDLENMPDGNQYIGFQNSSGDWYIMQNDERANRIRYYFGKGDYATAWDEKVSHDYTTLSEAQK